MHSSYRYCCVVPCSLYRFEQALDFRLKKLWERQIKLSAVWLIYLIYLLYQCMSLIFFFIHSLVPWMPLFLAHHVNVWCWRVFFSYAFASYTRGDDAVVKRVYSAIAVNARTDVSTENSLRLEISMYAFAKYKQISCALCTNCTWIEVQLIFSVVSVFAFFFSLFVIVVPSSVGGFCFCNASFIILVRLTRFFSNENPC